MIGCPPGMRSRRTWTRSGTAAKRANRPSRSSTGQTVWVRTPSGDATSRLNTSTGRPEPLIPGGVFSISVATAPARNACASQTLMPRSSQAESAVPIERMANSTLQHASSALDVTGPSLAGNALSRWWARLSRSFARVLRWPACRRADNADDCRILANADWL